MTPASAAMASCGMAAISVRPGSSSSLHSSNDILFIVVLVDTDLYKLFTGVPLFALPLSVIVLRAEFPSGRS